MISAKNGSVRHKFVKQASELYARSECDAEVEEEEERTRWRKKERIVYMHMETTNIMKGPVHSATIVQD